MFSPRKSLQSATAIAAVAALLLGFAANAAAQAPPPDGSAPPPADGAAPPPPPGATDPGAGHRDPTAPPPGHLAPAPLRRPISIRETRLQIAFGGEFFAFGQARAIIGMGPALSVSSQWIRWFGGFMIGGGTSFRYSYMTDGLKPADHLHQMTVNGDAMIGGGVPGKFAIYAHLEAGVGAIQAVDGPTGSKITWFWARATAGVGGYAHVTRNIAIGAVVDVGWPGTVQALVTLGFHFGKRR